MEDEREALLSPYAEPAAPRKGWRRFATWRFALLAAALLLLGAALLMSCIPDSPLQVAEMRFFEYVQNDMPTWAGTATFFALSAIFVALGLPATPLNIASGFILGGVLGTCCSMAGLELGAAIAFVLGRTSMRRWAEEKARAYKKFDAIARAVGEKGFVLVFLIRLSPVMPFGICCYVLGLTKVGFAVYCVATFLGLLPFTTIWCYLGTLITDLGAIFDPADESQANPLDSAWITVVTAVAGVVSTVLIVVFTAWVTKRALDKAILPGSVIQNDDLEAAVPIGALPPRSRATYH